MLMILTVIPADLENPFRDELKQTFDIQDPLDSAQDVVRRMTEEGGLDDVLKFVTRCRHRLAPLIGESVILVNFREPAEFDAMDEAGVPAAFRPSIN